MAPSDLPPVVRTVQEVRRHLEPLRAEGERIGFVPTMGALHQGHLSLVEACARECDATVVSIFVNPTQFGPHEDYDKYPRTLEKDLEALAPWGVDLVFAPAVEEMYPPGFQTQVLVSGVTELWEGRSRPGHFAGVTTVVAKLFHIVQPHVAYFGHKDYQQSVVVRQMVRDLNLPVEIRVCPTVREEDGLALSSRNAYLSPEQRQQALVLSRSLRLAEQMIQQGQRRTETILAEMKKLYDQQPDVRLDYLAVVEPDSLLPVEEVTGPVVVLTAAWVGQTRLIDNLRVEP